MSIITYTVKAYSDGDRHWFLNGKLHREDGPAIEGSSGSKRWFLNGELHRGDGPAVEYSSGSKEWFLNGVRYTEEGFNKKMSSVVEMTIVEIEMTIAEIEELVGKKVKVIK